MRTAILYNFLIEANIMASIAILLMMILRKTLRRTLGNSCICFGWLLAALRLLLPLSFANPVIHTIRSPFAEDAVIRPIAGQITAMVFELILSMKLPLVALLLVFFSLTVAKISSQKRYTMTLLCCKAI